jgi:DNA-binding NtrC family response regulator
MLPHSTPIRVIVADDERIIANSLAMILCARGHAARAVYSGEEAMDLAQTFRPNGLISDIMMPGIGGVELARLFAEQYPDCKVLLVSGHVTSVALAEESAQLGYFHSILPKPVHPA